MSAPPASMAKHHISTLPSNPELALSLPSSSSVSRLHCQLSLRHDGTVWLEDLGSANGTWLGDQRLPPHVPTPLTPGSCFFAGRLPLLLDRGGNEDSGLAARRPR